MREALSDNFNTPKAINDLSILVNKTNAYVRQDAKDIKLPLVLQISRYVFKMLKVFGLYKEGDFPSISGEQDELATELMNVLCKFRDNVKENANADGKEIMKLADELRDDILPYLGIRIEDKGKGNPSIWKRADRNELIKEREDKIAKKQAAEDKKRLD